MIWSNPTNWEFTVKINLKWKLHKATAHLTPVKRLASPCNGSQWCWTMFHGSLRMFLAAFLEDSIGCSQPTEQVQGCPLPAFSRYLLLHPLFLVPGTSPLGVREMWHSCSVWQMLCYYQGPCLLLWRLPLDTRLAILGVAVFKHYPMSLPTLLSSLKNTLESVHQVGTQCNAFQTAQNSQ